MYKLYATVLITLLFLSCTIKTKHDLVPVFKQDGQKVVSTINTLVNCKQVGFSGKVERKGKDSIATMSIRLLGISNLPESDSTRYVLAAKIAEESWKSLSDSSQFRFYDVYFASNNPGKYVEYGFEIH